jgi:hypothetical protein
MELDSGFIGVLMGRFLRKYFGFLSFQTIEKLVNIWGLGKIFRGNN